MSLAYIETNTSNRRRVAAGSTQRAKHGPQKHCRAGSMGSMEKQYKIKVTPAMRIHTGGVHLIADYQSPRQKPSQSQRAVTSFGYRRCLASVRDWQTQQARCRFISGCGVEANPKKAARKNKPGLRQRTPLSRRYLPLDALHLG